ncbi:gephyrin-like molybdotransferase Glp [Thermodesulfobacteriota bacterium]
MFFKVKTSEEVFEILKGFHPVEEERVVLEKALGRVLSKEVISPEDLPGFYRSTMDGYAVRARDTFGTTESVPVPLEVAGEVIMGRVPAVTAGPGKAVKISTGGMLPENSDGVVMLEYCHALDDKSIEVSRTISPWENVIRPDDDLKKGAKVLDGGHLLRPQDLGVLSGLGISGVSVYKKPTVAIISTGDEVIPADRRPKPGQVRDINSYTLSAFCRRSGATPLILGLCKDSFEQLRDMVAQGLDRADTVWLSGGSSMGTRDLTMEVFESFENMDLLAHGISISPGKPTIIARIGTKAVFGLPGHTASAMVVAEVFLNPFLSWLAGEKSIRKNNIFQVEAELSQNVESASGRDDYIRVKLNREGKKLIAVPIFGKSGLISTLVDAHGLLRVDRYTEGLYQGQKVKVMPFYPFRGESC